MRTMVFVICASSWAGRFLKEVGIHSEIRLQERFLLYCLGGCAFGGLTTWLSSGKLAEKTTTRAEVGGQLIHSLSEENFRAAARSLRHAKRVDVPRVDYEKLASDRAGESSEAVRQRVLSAREKQLARLDGSGLTCNADTPALAAQVQVWARRTSANTASWTRRAKP
jgi:hypothetical protein